MSDAERFWMAVAGDEHGVKLGMLAEIMADPAMVASMLAAVERFEHAESIGPITDPTAWRGNAFMRNRLCRDLLRTAIAFGRAEQDRRAKWDSR